MFPLCKRCFCKGISSTDGGADIHRRDDGVVEEGVVGGVCLDEMVGVFGVLLGWGLGLGEGQGVEDYGWVGF